MRDLGFLAGRDIRFRVRLGLGGFRVRLLGVRFRFGCWHVRFRVSGRKRN